MARPQRALRSNAHQTGNSNYVQALVSEVASRRKDPYEYNYMGILQSTDPLVREKGKAAQELYEDLMRDGKVFSCMEKRVMSMIARPWQITPVTDSPQGQQHAALITDILKRTRLDQVVRGLMDALLVGMSVAETVWTERDGYIVPDRIIKRSTRRFIYKEVDESTPPELRLITRNNPLEGEHLPDKKFIVHRAGVFDDNPYGQGIGLQLFWAVFFKRCSMVSWNKLNDRFGTPTAWGKYAPGSGRDIQQTLLDALRSISSDGVVVTPDNASIQLIEAAMSGNVNSHQALCAYLDNWIAAVLVGENAQEHSGGAMASASKERRNILLDLVQGDSDLLSDTLNETLLKWICEFNGFDPCQISRPIQEEEDLRAIAETYSVISSMGFKPSLSMVKEKFGDGWEVSEQNMQGFSGMGNLGGMGGFNSMNPIAPMSFAEAALPKGTGKDDADLVDDVVDDMPRDEFDQLMQEIITPILNQVDKASSFEEVLTALQNALPEMNTQALEDALTKAMFASQVIGRSAHQQGA